MPTRSRETMLETLRNNQNPDVLIIGGVAMLLVGLLVTTSS